MKTTVKLFELLDAMPALERLGKVKMPVKARYNLEKIQRKVKQELQDFETVRLELIRTNSRETSWHVPDENMEQFSQEYRALEDGYPTAPESPDEFDQADEALLQKYGKKMAQPGLRIRPWALPEINRQLNELAREDVELDIPLLDVDLLTAAGVVIGEDMQRIFWVFDEPGDGAS